MMNKRVFSLLLALMLLVQTIPVPAVYAAECTHHQHDGSCGYQAAVAGAACTHHHGKGCYTTKNECIHDHDEACGYAEPEGETPGAPCGHSCGEACQSQVLNCGHSHDDSCGYVAAASGADCTFVCEICAGETETPEPEKTEVSGCTKATDCAASSHEEGCLKAQAEREAALREACDQSADCEADLHKEGCRKEALAACTGEESCASSLHQEACPVGVMAANRETLENMIAALPSPDTIDPKDEEQLEAVHNQIGAIVSFALEKGLYETQDAVTSLSAIAAVLDAMYPKEIPSDSPEWDGTSVDTSWYEGEGPYTLDSAADLAGLAKLVNEGNNFAGKTVNLAASIDLKGHEWTPIGTATANPFCGTFNGGGKTISNLSITSARDFAGLFGRVGVNGESISGSVKNIKINNVSIVGNYYVGAVAGVGEVAEFDNCDVGGVINIHGNQHSVGGVVGRGNGAIKNCDVSGSISVASDSAYIGGIAGYGYFSIYDCSVLGTTENAAIAGDSSYVGGIIGFTGEGNFTISGCSVNNVSITGVDTTGGIAGMTHYGMTVKDSAVNGLVITTTGSDGTAGAIAGTVNGTAAQPNLLANDTVSNTTVNGAVTTAQTSGLTSNGGANSNYFVGEDVVFDGNGKVVTGAFSVFNPAVADSILAAGSEMDENGTVKSYQAKIGEIKYENFQDAISAVQSGDTVTLLKNVSESFETDESITLNVDKFSYTGTITLTKKNGILTIQGTGKGSDITLAVPVQTGYETGIYHEDTKVESSIKTVEEAGTAYEARWTLKKPTVEVSADKTSIVKNTGTALLTADAAHDLGADVLSYQWYKGDSAISGATGADYEVKNLTEDTVFSCKVKAAHEGSVSEEAASDEVTITVSAAQGTITPAVTALETTIGEETLTLDYTTNITGEIQVESSDETVATVSGNERKVTITIRKAGRTNITLSFPGDDDFTPVTVTVPLTVQKAQAWVTGTDIADAVYGQTITLTASVTKAEPGQQTRDTQKDRVEFLVGDKKLGEAEVTYTNATTGTATLSYNTTDGKLLAQENTVTLNFTGSDNLETGTGTMKVTMAEKELTITGLAAEDRDYDGTKVVTITGGTVSGIETADRGKVTVTLPDSGTVAEAGVGENKAVVYDVDISGTKSAFYTIKDLPSLTVDIEAAELTAAYVSEVVPNIEDPALEVKVTGFVNGETAATAHGYQAPKVVNPYTAVGTYELIPEDGEADNYTFKYVKGTLTIGYSIIKGAEQTVTKGNSATFVSNAPHRKFDSVWVDDKEVAKDSYTEVEGSTKVTLKASYIRSLKTGKHTLAIVSDDGEATTTFTVRSGVWGYDSPQTGDTTNTGLWIGLAVAGLAGMLAAILGKKYLIKDR